MYQYLEWIEGWNPVGQGKADWLEGGFNDSLIAYCTHLFHRWRCPCLQVVQPVDLMWQTWINMSHRLWKMHFVGSSGEYMKSLVGRQWPVLQISLSKHTSNYKIHKACAAGFSIILMSARTRLCVSVKGLFYLCYCTRVSFCHAGSLWMIPAPTMSSYWLSFCCLFVCTLLHPAHYYSPHADVCVEKSLFVRICVFWRTALCVCMFMCLLNA